MLMPLNRIDRIDKELRLWILCNSRLGQRSMAFFRVFKAVRNRVLRGHFRIYIRSPKRLTGDPKNGLFTSGSEKQLHKQAWLALVSSSNNFQMTLAFELWVSEDSFWRAPNPHCPPWIKTVTTLDHTWLILTLPEAIRLFEIQWSTPWCPPCSPTWSLCWCPPGSPDLPRPYLTHTNPS